jgi:hypothetical protein
MVNEMIEMVLPLKGSSWVRDGVCVCVCARQLTSRVGGLPKMEDLCTVSKLSNARGSHNLRHLRSLPLLRHQHHIR